MRGRRVGRGFAENYPDRVCGYHATEPNAKAMRKHKVWVEPLLAEAKDWHGLRRFRLRGRGLPKVNGEALLINDMNKLVGMILVLAMTIVVKMT